MAQRGIVKKSCHGRHRSVPRTTLVRRARRLSMVLPERARMADEARHLPDTTRKDLRGLGPARFDVWAEFPRTTFATCQDFRSDCGHDVYIKNPISRADRDLCTAMRHLTHSFDVNGTTHDRLRAALTMDNAALGVCSPPVFCRSRENLTGRPLPIVGGNSHGSTPKGTFPGQT